MDDEAELRAEIVRLARQMLRAGLVAGTAGNVSARLPGSRRFIVTPTGVDYEALEPDQLVAVDGDGQHVEPGLLPSIDTRNHAAIYGRRDDVHGVVHTHSPYAVAFAVVGEPIPALSPEVAGVIGGPVGITEDEPPAMPELADAVAAGLGFARAVLLPNHGVIAVGETVAMAFATAAAVEEGARIAWLARQIGVPRPVPADEVARMHDFVHRRYGQR
jgi:ribulose-5-phosphate 4-epimerase/fuculose-1-phosphate aldolase